MYHNQIFLWDCVTINELIVQNCHAPRSDYLPAAEYILGRHPPRTPDLGYFGSYARGDWGDPDADLEEPVHLLLKASSRVALVPRESTP